jgi:hypothetical protein
MKKTFNERQTTTTERRSLLLALVAGTLVLAPSQSNAFDLFGDEWTNTHDNTHKTTPIEKNTKTGDGWGDLTPNWESLEKRNAYKSEESSEWGDIFKGWVSVDEKFKKSDNNNTIKKTTKIVTKKTIEYGKTTKEIRRKTIVSTTDPKKTWLEKFEDFISSNEHTDLSKNNKNNKPKI